MSKTITCADCSARRSNARFKNTLYCMSCRLLRDMLYVGKEQRPCSTCKKLFAPVDRKDLDCGDCQYGSVHEGHCYRCNAPRELHRPGISVCVKCIRVPLYRANIIDGLRRGQRERREANGHAS
jgi:hypothetical protein